MINGSIVSHIPFDCKLFIQQQTVLDFSVEATFHLSVQAQSNTLEVKVDSFEKFVYFRDVGTYVVYDL